METPLVFNTGLKVQ